MAVLRTLAVYFDRAVGPEEINRTIIAHVLALS